MKIVIEVDLPGGRTVSTTFEASNDRDTNRAAGLLALDALLERHKSPHWTDGMVIRVRTEGAR